MKSKKEIEKMRNELRAKRLKCWRDAAKARNQKTKNGRLLYEHCQDIAICTDYQVRILNWALSSKT